MLGFSPNAALPNASVLTTLAGVSVNATLTVTNGADTISSTASLPLQATISLTEAGDTLASTASLPLQASLAVTNGADTVSSTAALALQAALSVTNGADAIASTAVLPLQATLSITEGPDTIVATGVLPLQASASLTEVGDTVSSDATHADTTWKFGSWLPIKYLHDEKKHSPIEAPAPAGITAAQLEAYLASLTAPRDMAAQASAIAAQIRQDIADQISSAHILHMAGQAAQLMAEDDDDAECLMLLAA